MNLNEDNSNTSSPSGLNQIINKNVVNTLSTTTSTSTIITNSVSSSNSAIPSDFVVNQGTNSSKKNTPRSNPASSIKDIDNLNEHQLKELLDEAFSYKRPKDREHKSETFRQMLENVEQEKDRIPSKHGGSLQDLVEAQLHNDSTILDYEYTYNNRNRRHHHNSRPKKFCSLVSARQREGGSLPSNVNVSSCNLAVYEPSFLNEVLNKHRIGGGTGGNNIINTGNKNERAVSVTSCNSGTSGNSSIGGSNIHDLTGNKEYDLLSNSGSLSGNNSADTVIDMGENYSDEKHLLALDSSKKGYPNSMEDDCIEIGIQLNNGNKKFTPRAPGFNAAHQGKLEHTAPEPKHYVDEPITFAALERGKTIVDTTCLPLNENYTSCKSLMGEKSELVKPLYTSTKNITKQCDENGNSLNSTFNSTTSTSQTQAKAKKKKSQSDRNTKIYNVTSVAGYRGCDPVDVLVKYIENTEDDKNKDNTKPQKFNENKRKDKKKDKENNNNNNNKKFKKSNSLEELRSCTKLDEDEKQEIVGNVTLRNKNTSKQNKYNNSGIGSNICSSTSSNSSTQSNTNETKENFKQQQQQQINHHKRGERRSWGTEELTYLGENNAIEEVREKAKDKEKKKSKDFQQQQINPSAITPNNYNNTIDLTTFSLQENDKMNKNKQDPISLSRVSIDSLQYESAAEFHVVTKKKKSKKRQTNSDVTNEFNNRNSSTGGLSAGGGYGNNNNNNKYKDGGNSGFGNQNKRYQITGNFTNDRDLYLHSFNANKDKKSRRKSTSSMPPSEKSDSSDLESVHSLPIESTTSSSSITRNNNNNNNNNQSAHATKSYADMARSNAAAAAAAAEAASTSALGDKLDKWPTVSGGNESSNSSIGNGNSGTGAAAGAGAGGNGNTKTMSNKKSSVTNKDFPELLSDKLNNNDLVNNAGGIINKSISYSQSLATNEDRKMNQLASSVVPIIINEKFNISSNINTGIKSPTLKPSTVTVASMTDGGLRSNETKILATTTNNITSGVNKQILQKSKSFETDNYYNSMDQYPALEKTVKRHIAPSTIVGTIPILTTQSQQQNIVNINNTQIQGIIPIISHQLQQQQTVIGNYKQTPKTIITNLPNTILPFTPNSNLTIIQSQQQLLNDNKSNIIIINPTTTDLNATNLNNVVLAGNTITTSATSSLNNLSHNITNTNNNVNFGKKTIIKQQVNNHNNQLSNAKVIDNTSSSHIDSVSLSPTTIIPQSNTNDQLLRNSNIDINTVNINNQLTNNRKISKNVSTVTTNIFDGPTVNVTSTSSGINNSNQIQSTINCRKYKRGDKVQQQHQQQHNPSNQEKHCISLLSSSTTTTTASNSNHKNQQQSLSSRPAVIILNEDSSNLTISSEFTFGDFKEEELRFYNSCNLTNNNNNNNSNIDINENNSDSSANVQSDNIINLYASGNNIAGVIFSNSLVGTQATNLSQSTNNDNNLDDSGAQFSFGSIGNIDTAINGNNSMNSNDIIDNDQQQEQQQHSLSSPISDFGYSSLTINNRSIISNDNSIDISTKLSSTAHDIENNNSVQEIDDNSMMTNVKLGLNSNNNNTVSNNILNNHLDNSDNDIKNSKDTVLSSCSSLKNCNQKGIKQSATCSPKNQSSSLLENTEKSSTSSSTILSNALLLSPLSKKDPSSSSSSILNSNKNIIISNNENDKTNISAATNTAIITSTTGQLPTSNNNNNLNNNNNNNNNFENQRRCIKEVNVRYVAPSQELNSMNFDKIVDFVGLAWEEIAHGNRGTQFYNGQ